MPVGQRRKQKTVIKLTSFFYWSVGIGFSVLLIEIIVAFVSPLLQDELPETMLVAKLAFVCLSILIGVLQLFLGILLSLLGINIEYEVDAKIGSTAFRLVCASPGLLLVLLSNLLIAFALSRSFEVSVATATKETDPISTNPAEIDYGDVPPLGRPLD